MPHHHTGYIQELAAPFRAGDHRALARLITHLDDGLDAEHLEQMLGRKDRHALKVGLTGSAGAGKSTLAAALVKHLRAVGQTVAVLACDPASPFTGGAFLGDRVRIVHDPADPGVFIRSLSTRGAEGGLSRHTGPIVHLLEQFGFQVILVETVGAGQDQMAVRKVVDQLVLVVSPETGDEIQWQKAGLLEAADVIAVNKADLTGADKAAAGLSSILELAPADTPVRPPPVLKVTATTGVGLAKLWQAVQRLTPRERRPPHR